MFLERAETYRRVLRSNLTGELSEFADWFADAGRLRVLAGLLHAHLRGEDREVLNIGCGPFATELYLKPLARHRILSFDYTKAFAPLYPILCREGFLANTLFFLGNALEVEFRENAFDLIIMHDLFFQKTLSVETLLDKYDPYLRVGGLLIFDVINIRTKWIWRLFGKNRYQRYHVPGVLAMLQDKGYEVLEIRPNLGTRKGLQGVLRWLLWHVFGLANNFAILAKKQLAA